jgi:hypothetical protein
MDYTGPFTLETNDLKFLTQDRAVEFFRRLLWAEASRVGIGRYLIDVPACINVGDGGIDAYIEDADPLFDDVILKGTTGFQIKSSDLEPAECKQELHQNDDLTAELKPEVKRIIDNGGNYVLVLFADLTSAKRGRRQRAIVEELSRLGYRNHVRVYSINQLLGYAERFISLVNWLRPDSRNGLPYAAWSDRSDIRYPATFVPDESRNQWMNEVGENLRRPDGVCPVIRVVSLSGIGKTRLVFEALAPDDLKNSVIYFPTAKDFQISSLYTTLQTDKSRSAILVIDECDRQYHEDFVRSFSSQGERLALFTISYDFGQVPPPAKLFKLDRLSIDDIKKVIRAEAKDLPDNIVSRLSEFADGYPRIATLLSDSYLKTGGTSDEFIRISDDGLMDRLIGQPELGQENFNKYKRVLKGISLFQKIGFEGPLEVESKWLSNYMEVDWTSFREAVQYERTRGIIQGDYYLFVTPFMLRVYLLNDWWEGFGFTKDSFDEFVANIPENFRADLIERFFEHIRYISTTEKGRKFALAMLGEGGIYADGELLRSELGANFFTKLTEADPDSALKCLQRTVGTWSKGELLKFVTGRREVVWSLERIAMWRELFQGAARLLLALGEAENETWSNNASGVFAGLFSPAPGQLAPTEAPPDERFVIVEEALNADSKEKRELALRACDQALQAGHFFRMVGNEKQGLRRTPELWQPKTYGEWFDSYRRVWLLISGKIENLEKDERQKAINILLEHSRGLGTNPHLTEMVIETLRSLLANNYVDETKVLAQTLNILRYDSKEMPPETIQKWESFRDDLSGSDFHSLIKRYVKMNVLAEDFDEEGKRADTVTTQIKTLAEQAAKDKDLLIPELSWLVTTDAQNGFQFGYELGEVDRDLLLLPTLLRVQQTEAENKSLFFLSGYFNSLYRRDGDAWDKHVEELEKDNVSVTWIPELTWRSGLTDRAAMRILRLAKSGQINLNQFRIFEYGSVIRNLSEEVFQEWIQFLLDASDRGTASTSLALYHFYYVDKQSTAPLPSELTYKLLANQALLEEGERVQTSTMDEFHWTEISKDFVQSYPDRAIDLADVIVENFGNTGSIVGGFHSSTQNILGLIAQKFPKEVWWKITKYLGPPLDKRAFHLKDWLNGDSNFGMKRAGAIAIFPLEEIFRWVDQDIDKRAWYFASFVPKELFISEERPCFAREVLIRYGDRQDVRNNLMANFSTEGWSGSAAQHLQNKKQMLLEFRKVETEENVIRWLDDYVASIDNDIDRARIREEREGY